MRNWDNVSFLEFEAVVGDLLGAELGVRFERFTAGADRGIDLRHERPGHGPDIVQCKHYRRSTWNDLRAAARAEGLRLARLTPQPESYRLATSLGLTPARKRELRELLGAFARTDGDILGIDDLEALLDRHPDVERRHIKLWLANGPQLQALLQPGIASRSRILAAAIQRALPLYVQSASFFDAWELLTERKTCLIAGPPGIGKTTLAHMLIAEAIGRDYEPIEASADIEEAWTALDQGRKQIFLYDDFLGHTVLGELAKNEDSRLLGFIHAAVDSPNTLFLMTTRVHPARGGSPV